MVIQGSCGKGCPWAGRANAHRTLPAGLSGDVTLEVRTPNGSASTTLHLKAVAPALFGNPSEPGTALATVAGELITSETPVGAGATIALYATGLSSGDAVHVRIGGAEAVSVIAQRVFAGVWEVSAKVPAASGNLAVQLSVNGVLSNELRLPVA